MKSSNILLDESGRAKVADVGLACQLQTIGFYAPAGTFVSAGCTSSCLLGLPQWCRQLTRPCLSLRCSPDASAALPLVLGLLGGSHQ